jgi:hypothetical protein
MMYGQKNIKIKMYVKEYYSVYVYVCVCVCVRERERERESVQVFQDRFLRRTSLSIVRICWFYK